MDLSERIDDAIGRIIEGPVVELDELNVEVAQLESKLEKHGPFCFELDTTPEAWQELQSSLAEAREEIERLKDAVAGAQVFAINLKAERDKARKEKET